MAAAAGLQQLFVHGLRIGAHDLVPTHKNKAGRHAGQIAKERRNQRIFGIAAVLLRIKTEHFCGHGGVDVFAFFVRRTGKGQVCPGRNGNDAAGQRKTQLFQFYAKAVA